MRFRRLRLRYDDIWWQLIHELIPANTNEYKCCYTKELKTFEMKENLKQKLIEKYKIRKCRVNLRRLSVRSMYFTVYLHNFECFSIAIINFFRQCCVSECIVRQICTPMLCKNETFIRRRNSKTHQKEHACFNHGFDSQYSFWDTLMRGLAADDLGNTDEYICSISKSFCISTSRLIKKIV